MHIIRRKIYNQQLTLEEKEEQFKTKVIKEKIE